QSTAVNPFYEYENPSVYDVCLNVSNEIASDTYCEQVIVEGLASVYPNTAGNTGDATLTIYGGGLDSLSVIIIEKDGVPIEIQDTTFQISRDAIRGRLDLREQPLGLYDIAVETGAGNRYVLEDAFTIEEGTRPDPWVEVSGRNRILFNTPTTYTVRYGNNGNVDASVVYIWLAFSDVPDLEIEFTGVLFESPDLDIDSFVVQADLDPELLYISTDSVLGEPFQARVYPLIMPVIPANTVNEFNIKIKTPETLKIQSWTNEPIFQSSLNYEKTFDLDEDLSDFNFNALKCLSAIYTKTYIDEIPYLTNTEVNCIIQAHANNYLSLTTAVEKGLSPIASSSFNGKGIVSQLVFIVKTLKKCNVSLAEGDKREMADVVTQILLNELISIEGDSLLACLKPMCAASIIKPANQKNEQDCPQCGTFCANNIIENQVEAVSSLDPNKKDSPGGYTNKNYIKFRQTIPYTIHFENVDTADVPAHKVRVIDTLDAHKFDFTSFQFGSITIADTTVYPEKGHERLLMDVGLPHLDVVARIEANFDAQSGKLEWLFRSLDPVTLEEIEDPDVGFLPPNVSKPEGQGSVSFFIDLKDDLENEEEVLNDALIYFDANEAIETNVSSFTLDLGLPSSQVQALDYETYDTLIPLYWDGTDNESGVRFYDVYVSENQDTFYRWRTRTNQVFDYFIGEPGSTYRFFSIAVDSVGNEEVKEDWDAETNILVGTENIPQLVKCLTISPNPAKDDLSIQFYLEEAGDIQINISNLLGSHIKDIWRGRAMTGVNQFEAGLYGIPDGVYMVNVKVDGAIMSKKFVVMR
ncbi:MAG: T9SS type A sorting domain-containing protein, partial [Bacteroidetes bacterium]|nr:T9SS type A sorting domain-containing protein [Bacteroidota bacterium]